MSEGGRLERAATPRPLRVLAAGACTCRPGYCRRAGMPRCGACAGLAAWEQCRAVAQEAAPGSVTPLRTYASACCGVVASYPSHQDFCDGRHGAAIWRLPAVVAAREYLAGMDAAYADVGVPRPLAGHLRAVLAEIDKAAGVS